MVLGPDVFEANWTAIGEIAKMCDAVVKEAQSLYTKESIWSYVF